MELMLETLQVADRRRTRAAWAAGMAVIQRALGELARGVRLMLDGIRRAAWQIERFVRRVVANPPEGYFWRDGRLRRDHGYFRQRARDRRAAAKWVKSASRS